MFLPSRFRILLCIALALTCAIPARAAVDPKQRSSSRQFTVYCSDFALRTRVINFAEQVKSEVLQFLNIYDAGRQAFPIVITIESAASGETVPPATVQLYEVGNGIKVQIDVRIGDDPAAVNLQKHLVRALLLEFAYRQRPGAVQGGSPYLEAPWWVVEGMIQVLRRRDIGVDTGFFQRMLEADRLPNIEKLITTAPNDLGLASRAIDEACAMCLVQLLIDQPDGRASLARFLRALPEAGADPVAVLRKSFPQLQTEQSLQKWWTVNIARMSAADRYQGLSPEETDAQLAALLTFELPISKDERRTFTILDFPQYLKIPASRAALAAAQSNVVALSAQANALYRPVIAEYEQIFGALVKGKSGGIRERLVKVENYRETVLRRTTDIADYLNWIEATQFATRSEKFDGYLKVANEMSTPAKRDDPITKYLDEIAQEF
ncbi:MAG: hypothetical protein ACO1QR_08395 [Chthoniobacteraceae bacterium]